VADTARIVWDSAGMHHVPADDSWLDEHERRRLGGMRFPKRRLESRLARWTAKTTVARALGLPTDPLSLGRVTVRNAPDGAPEVTVDGADVGIVIGMTDRADWAVCSVLHGRHRVGCDLELVEPRSAAFVQDYFTPREVRFVLDAPRAEHDLLATLVWSAKESALKVLRTGLRRDTRSVEVTLGDEASRGWRGLQVRADGVDLHGWWVRHGQFVLTCVAAVPCDPPESLVEPPALSAAVPTHGWMAMRRE
jgi:4'-phosphopantetheinyl transferase